MKRLFYLFVSLIFATSLCVCISCKKTEKVEQKQEVIKTEEVEKGNVTTPAPKPKVTVEEAKKIEEAVSEEKITVKQVAPVAPVDLAAGKEVYEKKGMCIMCHGADGSKPFKLTKLFTGKDYTVKEQEEWIEKEPQMKMLKNKLTKQDLINVTGYLNQKLKK